jgi:hypothetical protein
VAGTSSDFTLTYGAATIECPSVSFEGTTGLDSDRQHPTMAPASLTLDP